MANISDAFGTIEIMANDVKVIYDLIYLMDNTLNNNGYYTAINEEVNNVKIDDLNGDYKHSAIVSFDACGRWSYQENIEKMFSWIKRSCSENDQLLLDNLEKQNFKMIFDYTDREPGCEIFGRYVNYIVHKSGDDLFQYTVYDGDYEEYDECIVNYCEYLGMDFIEAVEELSFKFDLDDPDDLERFKNELLDQSKDIEKYFKKDWKSLISVKKELVRFLDTQN